MASCEEATFFIRSFPGTKMDGDNDGNPAAVQPAPRNTISAILLQHPQPPLGIWPNQR
ncbi:hypothetical protein [Comamonas thiooxydans]|uniref:hypothetical protein n=1 Tax=Comamonas thiooxydans TaxID=363952 RepID=UPI000B34DD88|nr:hypothetical protein [Comamonas thiooxydans]